MSARRSTPARVLSAAQALLHEDKLDDARELLLDEGYVLRSEPAIQKAYPELIPVGPTLRRMLGELYKGLSAGSARARAQAATAIARELARETLRDNVRWMRDPRATGPLIAAAADNDAVVAERALLALSRTVCKYFPDQRALPVFSAALESRHQRIRTHAISGIGCLRQEEPLEQLVPLLEHGTDQDRVGVARQIAGLAFETPYHTLQHPIEWSRTGRERWGERMVAALGDPQAEVRKQAAFALKNLGARDALPALKRARRREEDQDTGFFLDDAVTALESDA